MYNTIYQDDVMSLQLKLEATVSRDVAAQLEDLVDQIRAVVAASMEKK